MRDGADWKRIRMRPDARIELNFNYQLHQTWWNKQEHSKYGKYNTQKGQYNIIS